MNQNKFGNEEREFQLILPNFSLQKAVSPDSLETKEEQNKLRAILKKLVENEFKDWLENDYDLFFEKKLRQNLDDWKEDGYSFSDKLIHRTS